MADVVSPRLYGRAYGFERAMDNLGAIVGPFLAIGLVGAVGVRGAIGLWVIPGLLAAAAIVYAIRHTATLTAREHRPIRLQIRPVLQGRVGQHHTVHVLIAGAALLASAYLWFAAGPSGVALLAPAFVLASLGIGCAETAEHAAVAEFAPEAIRRSSFALLTPVSR